MKNIFIAVCAFCTLSLANAQTESTDVTVEQANLININQSTGEGAVITTKGEYLSIENPVGQKNAD